MDFILVLTNFDNKINMIYLTYIKKTQFCYLKN